ncbi:DsbA family protein [Stackebrandtia soli]|uniref:DsbA family protein n=1 Tax=Stackebrandtia soli TaxID=1892856 RepID=UPI0039EACFB7
MAKRYEQKKKAAQIVRQQQEREERRRQLVLGGAILGVIILLGGIIAGGIWLSQRGQYDVVQPKAEHTKDGALVVGEGPVTVDLYIDFMCPACKNFEAAVAGDIDTYLANGSITVNYHPLAFLNRFSQGTAYSSRSAAASVCAADEGMFVEYSKALFAGAPAENTSGLSDAELITIGEDAGIGGDFKTCVENETYRGWIEEGTVMASEDAKVTATPTVLIDGSKVANDEFLAKLAAAVEEAGVAPESSESPGDEESPADEETTKDEEEGTEPETTESPSPEN